MAITPFEKDIEIIQKLDDEPNDVQGLTPEELKKRFDQAAIWLKEYINGTLIPAITGDGGTGGASNIGAAVDDFPGETVQEVLDAFNDALTDRYTKAETNSYVGQETENLVETVHVDLTTGVITVTKKDGSKETFDTALEKVPATMALVDEESGTYLVITNVDGSQTKTDVSKLIDTYTFQNSAEVAFSVDGSGNNKTVTASIRPASIGLDRFTLEVTQKLEQYNATSKANADAAAASAQAAKASETNAKGSETAASGSASQSAQSAGAASGSASQAAQSAGAAAASAESAQSNAAQALAAKNAAEASATLSQSWTEGGTGIREGENTNNAKYWAGVAQGAAGGGVTTFNGRSGAVVPAKGDYTAEMVGARPESWIPSAADTGAVPITEKGQPGGVATLGPDGKVPGEQLPKMDYDPAGSAEAVQQALTAHTGNKNNPHGVTAEQVGAFTKEETASDDVISLYGLESDDTPNDIFLLLYKKLKMINEGLAEVTIIAKTQSGNPLKGILLPDLKDSDGKDVYTDSSGKATFFAKGGTTAKITFSNYGDIEDFTESFTVNSGEIIAKEITLKVRNFFRVTSTQNVRFTKNTSRVDVSVGGGGGGAGRIGKQSSGDPYRSAGGGGGGYAKSQENVEFVTDTTYTATVGAGGNVDEKGGTSSFMGVSAQGGEPGQGSFDSSSNVEGGQGNGNGADGVSTTFSMSVEVPGNAGKSGANTIFNSFESSTPHGGGGGSGSLKRPGRYDSIDGGRGGSPGGGDGGDAAQNNERNGKNGTNGTGGGGGSAGIWYDEGSASFGTPGVGGSGVVTMRMHLISA